MANRNLTKPKKPKQQYPAKDDTVIFVSKTIKGRSYEGEVLKRNGKPHGQGKMIYKPGSDTTPVYTGSWKLGKRCGYGEYKCQCYSYKGDWKKNMFHGKGLFDNGYFQYEGEFKKGLFDGYGETRVGSDWVYRGYFQKNMMHGVGTAKYPQGYSYTGEFYQGTFHGSGTYKWGNGTWYEGQWKSGNRTGCGKYFNSEDESLYEGDWMGNSKHGKGTMKLKNGDIITGTWERDKIVGIVLFEQPASNRIHVINTETKEVYTEDRSNPLTRFFQKMDGEIGKFSDTRKYLENWSSEEVKAYLEKSCIDWVDNTISVLRLDDKTHMSEENRIENESLRLGWLPDINGKQLMELRNEELSKLFCGSEPLLKAITELINEHQQLLKQSENLIRHFPTKFHLRWEIVRLLNIGWKEKDCKLKLLPKEILQHIIQLLFK